MRLQPHGLAGGVTQCPHASPTAGVLKSCRNKVAIPPSSGFREEERLLTSRRALSRALGRRGGLREPAPDLPSGHLCVRAGAQRVGSPGGRRPQSCRPGFESKLWCGPAGRSAVPGPAFLRASPEGSDRCARGRPLVTLFLLRECRPRLCSGSCAWSPRQLL